MGAGRPVGSKSNPKNSLMAALRARYGSDFDPVMKIAENAMMLDKIAKDAVEAMGTVLDLEAVTLDDMKAKAQVIDQVRPALNDAVNAWDRLSVYCKPKLKAIDISGSLDTKTLVKIIDLSGETPTLNLEELEKVEQMNKAPNKKIVVKSKPK